MTEPKYLSVDSAEELQQRSLGALKATTIFAEKITELAPGVIDGDDEVCGPHALAQLMAELLAGETFGEQIQNAQATALDEKVDRGVRQYAAGVLDGLEAMQASTLSALGSAMTAPCRLVLATDFAVEVGETATGMKSAGEMIYGPGSRGEIAADSAAIIRQLVDAGVISEDEAEQMRGVIKDPKKF